MKKIKQLALLTTCMACNPMIVFADEYRMDKQLLTAILYFLQMCSSVFFALGIGMLIWSVQSEDGAKKTGALKRRRIAMFTNLKQKKEALTNKFDRFFSFDDKVKMVQAGSALATSLCCMSIISMAAVNTADIFGTLIGYICQIFLYIGIILLVWAVGQLVLAFKNEDADSKSRAVMVMVCSIILMSVGQIVKTVLDSTGTGVTVKDVTL